ncbi:11188_t:CDS:2, partial [Gigaspora margarita]
DDDRTGLPKRIRRKFYFMSCFSKNCKENQLNIQIRSEISFDGSEELSPRSILSTLSMFTNQQAKTSAAATWRNVYQQKRKDEQDDLINFDPRENEDGYTSPTYPDYTVRPTTPIPIYYEIQLDKGKVDDNHMVITDPDDTLVLPLHDVITDDYCFFGTRDSIRGQPFHTKFQVHFDNMSSLPQRCPPTPVQIPPPRRATPILRRPVLNQLPNLPAQQPPPPNPSDHQLGPRAAIVNPIDQLLQSNQNLLTWLDEFDEACVANHISEVRRFDILPSHLKGPAYTWWRNIAYTVRSWNDATRPRHSFTHLFEQQFCTMHQQNQWVVKLRSRQQGLGETVNEYYNELERLYRKADPTGRYLFIDRIRQFMDRLRQELREPVEMECPTTLQQALKKAKATEAAYSREGPLSSYFLKRSYLNRESNNNEEISELRKAILEITRNMKTLWVRQNRPNNGQGRSHRPNGCIPNISSENNQNQRESNENQTYLTLTREELTEAIGAAIRNYLNIILNQPLLSNLPTPLVLNSKIETPDAFHKSLISYEFLKKIRKEIDKPSVRNLIDVHGQKKYPLGVVENLLIVVNKVEVPIDVEVTEAKDYAIIVGTNWLEKMPITCWKRMTYNLGKPVLLEKKSRINSEEIDEEENKEEYEVEEVEEERSYVVQRDEDELPIVEIKKKTVSIEGKEANIERYKEIEEEMLGGVSLKNMKHGWKGPGTICIETLKCLVDNLDEELGISRRTKEYANLDKNQQTKVEELMENNKFLFAEGLTQLGRTKEEIHTITLKEGVEPVKQKPYRISHTENEFISQE